jgi:hypothetical protein
VTIDATIKAILAAETWTQRIQQIRLVPQRHGTGDHGAIYAAVARELYMPHLAPDFAYIHESPFYEPDHFFAAYDAAAGLTEGFTRVTEPELQDVLFKCPRTLLVFRTLLGLTKDEFAHSTLLAGGPSGLSALTAARIDTLERMALDYQPPTAGVGLAKAMEQAQVAATTITMAMNGELFGDPPTGLKSKQRKADTEQGWQSVSAFAANGVPLRVFLHQRHYGGAYRQVLDATSTQRGDLIEDAVEALFKARGISFIRTGSHNQADIARRFEVHVTPAPDFVVFDPANDSLAAMLECKGTNNGGTARDKALRFRSLRAESVRLGGVPLIAVLGGIGWARINDALGPVVRDTDGRVFTLSTLESMLEVAPFPGLVTLP